MTPLSLPIFALLATQLNSSIVLSPIVLGMGALFSHHRSRVTEHDKAVLQLKQQRDELKRYSRRINDSIEKDTAAIKELVSRKQKQ